MLKIARSGLRCRATGACSQALRSFALQANTQFSTLRYKPDYAPRERKVRLFYTIFKFLQVRPAQRLTHEDTECTKTGILM
jgi:hypothetical protein